MSAPEASGEDRQGTGALAFFAVILAIGLFIAAVTGVFNEDEDSEPDAPFLATDRQVEELVEAEGGKRADASCGSGSCGVTYVAETPAFSSDETVEGTAPIFKELFTDKSLDEAVLKVKGRLTSEGGKTSVGTVFIIRCDRSDARKIAWSRVDADGLKSICEFSPFVADL